MLPKSLPEELLVMIFDFATLNDRVDLSTPKRDNATLRSLDVVSHQFHRMIQPLLFEEISFTYFGEQRSRVPPIERARQVHELLKHDHESKMRRLCVAFYVDIDDYGQENQSDYQIVLDLLSWFTSLRSLAIVGGFFLNAPDSVRAHTLEIINHIKDLGQLRALNLEGHIWDERGGITLAEVMKSVDSQSLDTLEVSTIGRSGVPDIEEMIDTDKLRTASFTNLRLIACKDDPEAIAALIHWPKQLINFTINTSGNWGDGMSLQDMAACLSIHKDTLTTISIDLLGRPRGLTFDTRKFPHLDELWLSRTQICEDPLGRRFEWDPVHADLLLGPSLRTFGLVFGVMGHTVINNWGSLEEKWIRQLAKAAWERGAVLSNIVITFDPSDPHPHPDVGVYQDGKYEYPWERMDKLAGEIKEYGLTLHYSTPTWTKEEWLSLCGDQISNG
ncbi:hypothetical protein N7493_009505 [Penicillium malachiteum]|uniref:F-box domain-containing protein n=1 Tax=Penicillium malachiteum TaxID=1324776 RepID=A0AAD6MSF4_9EURO|nr:hypothetical protein N7493_009505 [Penicillium malachiteum]